MPQMYINKCNFLIKVTEFCVKNLEKECSNSTGLIPIHDVQGSHNYEEGSSQYRYGQDQGQVISSY